jgi:hypothetical protein
MKFLKDLRRFGLEISQEEGLKDCRSGTPWLLTFASVPVLQKKSKEVLNDDEAESSENPRV